MCINSFSTVVFSHRTDWNLRCREVTGLEEAGPACGPQQSGVRAYALVHSVTPSLPDLGASGALRASWHSSECTQGTLLKQQPVFPTTQELLFYSHPSVLYWSQRAEKGNKKNLAVMGINTPSPCIPPSGSLRITSEYWKQVKSSCMFSWQTF